MLERKIIQGLITSTTFAKQIRPYWDPLLLESSTARMIAGWCISHFDKYKKAPNKEIEVVFYQKVEEGLDKEIAEEIEEDILPDLSEEYVEEGVDPDFLFKETLGYLKSRQIKVYTQQLQNILDKGHGNADTRLKEAEEYRRNFKPIVFEETEEDVDFSKVESLKQVRKAFEETMDPIIHFPKQLGKFWGDQFYPGAFIGILAPEKRYKTWWLLQIAMLALRQGKKVAMFQAGDMTKNAQIKRMGIYLCRRSNIETYCSEYYKPVRDCVRNQLNTCDKKVRECDFGVFEDIEIDGQLIDDVGSISYEDLVEAYEANDDYKPCYNCKDYDILKLGAPWLKKMPATDPITADDAVKAFRKFYIKNKRHFKLSSHPNGTLSCDDIESKLDKWEDEGFVPHIILVDYLELLVPPRRMDHRHEQNEIAKQLRKISQTHRKGILPCLIVPTQADAKAYAVDTLKLENYSEDKRKYAHVTAMYGINQDPKGREKKIGLARLNEIIMREGDFNFTNSITILQDIRTGRPLTGSYFSNNLKND